MNGTCEMYEITPQFNYPTSTEKPEMYEITSIYSVSQQQENSATETIDPDLLNLEKRQENLLNQLENLSSKLQQIKQQITQVPSVAASSNVNTCVESAALPAKRLPHFVDAVVTAPPSHQPFGLLVLTKWLQERHKVLALCHVHSSLDNVRAEMKSLFQSSSNDYSRVQQEMLLTLIWKDGSVPTLIVSPSKQSVISGDVNIIRYLAGLIAPAYHFEDPVRQTSVDAWLDLAHHSVRNGNNKERQGVLRTLNSHLGKNAYLVGGTFSVADVGVLSALLQTESVSDFPTNVKRWFKSCSENQAISESLDALSVKLP